MSSINARVVAWIHGAVNTSAPWGRGASSVPHPIRTAASKVADSWSILMVIALAALRERGDLRGLAASLAHEHGVSPDVWSRAVNATRKPSEARQRA
ncbi:hypothetical protein OG788_40125 [Streptomyces sp. NBC_00647]|uniref:hypothetical protein n=1 Tax=Streptomyces sp. NBC_00647 TaxID=2975796 RepID=UPI0032499888